MVTEIMKKENHPLAIAQQKQAAFERTLPKGRLYSPQSQTAIHQYKDAMARLSLCGETVCSALPRAFIFTLAAANQFKIDLVERLAEEVPASRASTNFVTLSQAFAKGTRTDLRGNDVYRRGDDILGHAVLYAGADSPCFTEASPINMIVDQGGINDRREGFKFAVVTTVQDILTVAGLLNRPHIRKVHQFTSYDLLKRTESLWRQLTL